MLATCISLDVNFCKDRNKIEVPDPLAVEDLRPSSDAELFMSRT